ncbi:MAG: hypothetical protein Q8P95_05385 [bacterium]|nr:hypothetical protein [bacterium]
MKKALGLGGDTPPAHEVRRRREGMLEFPILESGGYPMRRVTLQPRWEDSASFQELAVSLRFAVAAELGITPVDIDDRLSSLQTADALAHSGAGLYVPQRFGVRDDVTQQHGALLPLSLAQDRLRTLSDAEQGGAGQVPSRLFRVVDSQTSEEHWFQYGVDLDITSRTGEFYAFASRDELVNGGNALRVLSYTPGEKRPPALDRILGADIDFDSFVGNVQRFRFGVQVQRIDFPLFPLRGGGFVRVVSDQGAEWVYCPQELFWPSRSKGASAPDALPVAQRSRSPVPQGDAWMPGSLDDDIAAAERGGRSLPG